MRDVDWSLIYQLQGFCFKHKPKKFLVRFCLEDDGFAVEAIVKKNFIWCKFGEAFVSKNQTIVNIADVPNEQMMIGEDLAESTRPNLFTDGNDHKAESWGERAPHGTSSALTYTSLAQGKGLHVQSRLDQVRNVFDDNLPSDIETTKCASFDDVTWIVGFAWIDGESFIVGDISSLDEENPRSMNQERTNLSWSILVKKPARSWLTRMRSASTGASRRMDSRV